MHDLDAGIALRVAVFVADPAVRRPTGMTDARMRFGEGRGGETFFQNLNFSRRLLYLQALGIDADARAVITAVGELFECRKGDIRRVSVTGVTDDTTHSFLSGAPRTYHAVCYAVVPPFRIVFACLTGRFSL